MFASEMTWGTQTALSLVGLGLLIVSAIAAVVTRLYHKSSANMAFVRTGMGGIKPIKDGGTIVLPVVHQVIPVSLETMRLNVERRGPHALITRDNLRVDLAAEFYIRVQANTDDIINAARSLGSRNVNPQSVSELVQEKLVSALRTVAATQDLVELHSKRDEFASKVQAIVTHDLASNGLTLESVTISALDQTDPTQLQERNVFDAQGLRKIAEITQKAKVERNEIEQEAQQQITNKNVAVRKQILDMQRDQAEFEAEQRAKVANVQAAREREIQEFKLAQDEAVARRDIDRQREIETAEVQRRLTVEQAEIQKQVALVERERERETAEVQKQQAIEVAQRLREAAIAAKEQERAAAQAAALQAEAQREAAAQRVLTVEVEAKAERDASQKLIAAKQVINENRIREETHAEVLAFQRVKEAEADKAAAQLQYEAKLKLATGDAEAEQRRAEGERARKLVDVQVERERVDVQRERVEVERQELANKSEFEDAALQFELDKLRIEADKQVRIAAAQALGNMLSKANMQIFGDPDTMARMSSRFMAAASLGNSVDGFMKALPPGALDVISQIGGKLGVEVPSGNGQPTESGAPASVAAEPPAAAAEQPAPAPSERARKKPPQ
jgi:uncharacterized membrane protein YqiK